jgi:hypothetical protein
MHLYKISESLNRNNVFQEKVSDEWQSSLGNEVNDYYFSIELSEAGMTESSWLLSLASITPQNIVLFIFSRL